MTDTDALLEGLLEGDHRALARTISVIENRAPGYADLVSALYRRPGTAAVVGITGSPGVGKSTLVDALIRAYADRDATVGVIAVDPASPFTGGSVLGDRIRMRESANDEDVFVRSMSARGAHGGLAAATLDAVRAMSAAGIDVVIVETVGAGQNEVDVVSTADTVVVVAQPASGDDVQALKAGILEIGDVYVVNKADLPGADRTARDLREMVEAAGGLGSHRAGPVSDSTPPSPEWTPPVIETVATDGSGLDALLSTIDAHQDFLTDTDGQQRKDRIRFAASIRTHLRAEVERAIERAIEAEGGIEPLVDAVVAGETDPYGLASDLFRTIIESDLDTTARRRGDRK